MRFTCLLAVAFASQAALTSKAQMATTTKVPAFDSVITMLQNLISQIDTELASDETDYGNFMSWFEQQSASTSSSISSLSSKLQELAAVLADLRSRQHTLSTEVARLNGEIEETQTAIQDATEKRNQEHASFVQEQLDFDNSIAACNKAVEILHGHFGDGTPKEDTRPAWMSFMQELSKVKVVHKHMQAPLTALLQAAQAQTQTHQQTPGMRGSQMFDEYQGQGDAALGIVGQVQELAATFSEDKQSSIDQENELTEAFNTLMKEKTEQLNSLIAQRDQQQAVLNQVNQEIGENENAEATAKNTLQDEQAFLSRIEQQERDTTMLFDMRKKDRTEEKSAVTKAISVLSQEAPSLLQLGARTRRAAIRLHAGCRNCGRAAKLLKASATRLHSELLATAAMTTGSGEALIPVIGQLTDLVRRIEEQQHAEEEHKEWCENELAETNQQKSHHEQLVEELKNHIEETEAVIAEKKQSIADTLEAIKTADEEMKEMEAVRAKEKQDYEAEHADYVDSINALNQAIDILGDFYREDAAAFMQAQAATQQPYSFIQFKQPVVPDAAARADVPEMATLSGGYVKKGGGAVVTILKTTRQDFEAGKFHLEKEEQQAVKDFEAAKDADAKSRADLVDAGNTLNAELQTAQLALAQYQTDLASNTQKVQALTSYLAQVGGSCNMLIENFGERTRLRNEEKESITQAIHILQSAA
jgi:chromosome segregation ATPase